MDFTILVKHKVKNYKIMNVNFYLTMYLFNVFITLGYCIIEI
jgi:hypothetical protein